MHFQLASVLVFAFVGALIVWFLLAVGSLLRPRHPNPSKASAYECGEPPVGSPWIRFNLRFYIIALVFIIFDV
jgi:NADH-quinone oxidoreductase subunit A